MEKVSIAENKETYLAIFMQICKAVEVLHDLNVIHRDIKPDNIFLNKNGYIKLGNFGHLKETINWIVITDNNKNIKSFHYMAPEYFKTKLSS